MLLDEYYLVKVSKQEAVKIGINEEYTAYLVTPSRRVRMFLRATLMFEFLPMDAMIVQKDYSNC